MTLFHSLWLNNTLLCIRTFPLPVYSLADAYANSVIGYCELCANQRGNAGLYNMLSLTPLDKCQAKSYGRSMFSS